MNGAPPRHGPGPGGNPGQLGGAELLLFGLLGALVAIGSWVWLSASLGALIFGSGWPGLGARDVGHALMTLPGQAGDPARAFPRAVRAGLAGPVGFYIAATLVLALGAALAWAVVAMRRGRGLGSLGRRIGAGRSLRAAPAQWATRHELRDLIVSEPAKGRLVLGRSGRRLVATEAQRSALVIGPEGSYKTTGLAIPAILEWEGPVLCTSIKSDLVRDTLAHRSTLGQAWVYDPTACTGLAASGWTPLVGCEDWREAQRTAASLAHAARPEGNFDGGEFWYATAAKLLAPLLHAAALDGRAIGDVVNWIDAQERDEPEAILAQEGNPSAQLAARASFGREPRQLSSVYTTAENVLAAYADPYVAASAERAQLSPSALLDGGAHTAYLCAPAHEQQRLRPLFTTLVQQVVNGVYERSAGSGKALDPPLLIVLDEAANIAPLRDLDTLASTARGQGIQLVSIFQDFAQLLARYGDRAYTVANNHRAKLVLSGISDPRTLEYIARLLGDEEVRQSSQTIGESGRRSTTESSAFRQLAPANVLRQIEPGGGVLVYGHLPPAELELRPFFRDRHLSALAEGEASGQPVAPVESAPVEIEAP